MSQQNDRATWSGKLAFVLAGAASAVGLGSMWRFPYLAAKYGGGTFLFLYLVFVFTIGIALLLLETAFGRKTGQSCIGAFKSFGKSTPPSAFSRRACRSSSSRTTASSADGSSST